MFCSQCGLELKGEKRFCTQCGAQNILLHSDDTEHNNADHSVITVQPEFVGWATRLHWLPLQLFISYFAGCILTMLFMELGGLTGMNLPFVPTLLPSIVCAYLMISTGYCLIKKKSYEQTEYVFYPDRVEYSEGFWNADNKTIKYTSITESKIAEGVLQKKCGLGNIILSTPGIGAQRKNEESGIIIRDIRCPGEIFNRVHLLIRQNS